MKNLLRTISILFVLTFVKSKDREFPIPNFEKEVELFKGKRVFFPDERGKPVLAKLEIPKSLPRIKDMDKEITFRLYTKETGDNYQILKINDVKRLAKSSFDPKRPTRFFSHGWQTDIDGPKSPGTRLRDAFLENEDCNIIILKWTRMSLGPYTVVRIYMQKMAQHVASMIDFLETQGMNLNNTSLIGISLGAHVMGVAGYRTKNKVNHVLGLDPAWPLYAFCGPESRISEYSGTHVEIIHTNGGFLGHPVALGHFDFYPNGGGRKQPGCILDVIGLCSHNRAFILFIESLLSSNGFYGMQCDSYKHFQSGSCSGHVEIMGGTDPTLKKRGIYYLDTNYKHPFAIGKISPKTKKCTFASCY